MISHKKKAQANSVIFTSPTTIFTRDRWKHITRCLQSRCFQCDSPLLESYSVKLVDTDEKIDGDHRPYDRPIQNKQQHVTNRLHLHPYFRTKLMRVKYLIEGLQKSLWGHGKIWGSNKNEFLTNTNRYIIYVEHNSIHIHT